MREVCTLFFFFFLFLFWFILCDFLLLLLLFLNQEGRSILCTTLPVPLISVGAFSSLITWHLLMLSQLPQMQDMNRARKERMISQQTTKLSQPSLSSISSLPFLCSTVCFGAGVELERNGVWSQQTFHWSLLLRGIMKPSLRPDITLRLRPSEQVLVESLEVGLEVSSLFGFKGWYITTWILFLQFCTFVLKLIYEIWESCDISTKKSGGLSVQTIRPVFYKLPGYSDLFERENKEKWLIYSSSSGLYWLTCLFTTSSNS